MYDINKKNYLLKFTNAGDKHLLLIEASSRIHTIQTDIEKNTIPSGLTMKMRKNLRTRRLEKIEQLGVERVLRLTFGSGEYERNLFIELYAAGNLILTDSDMKIICLTRSHKYTEEIKTAVGEYYPIELAAGLRLENFNFDREFVMGKWEALVAKGKKAKLADLFFGVVPCCHGALIAQVLGKFGLQDETGLEGENVDRFLEAIHYAADLYRTDGKEMVPGYLVRTRDQKDEDMLKQGGEVGTDAEVGSEGLKPEFADALKGQMGDMGNKADAEARHYFEFTPVLFESQRNEKFVIEEFPDFDLCIEKYFNNLEHLKNKTEDVEETIWKKYEKIKADQEGRLDDMRKGQDIYLLKAQLIEGNIQEIQAVCDIINGMISSGMNA